MQLGRFSYIIDGEDGYSDKVIVGNYTGIGKGFDVQRSGNHPNILDRRLVSSYPFQERYGAEYYPKSLSKGEINIGHDVWIADNVTVMSGITIGNGAIIAANSVVTKDVEPFTLVAGNPARFKYRRFDGDQIEYLENIKWWEWDKDVVMERLQDFKDIDLFIEKYKE